MNTTVMDKILTGKRHSIKVVYSAGLVYISIFFENIF